MGATLMSICLRNLSRVRFPTLLVGEEEIKKGKEGKINGKKDKLTKQTHISHVSALYASPKLRRVISLKYYRLKILTV
jgi:hypothetical protein